MPESGSLQQAMDSVRGAFVPAKAKGMEAVIQYDLSGDGGGSFFGTISGGAFSVSPGTAPNPKLTLSMKLSDFLELTAGRLGAVKAFAGGKMKVRGDTMFGLKLQSMFQFG